MTDGGTQTPPGGRNERSSSLLPDAPRDARLRERAREKIRYELAGAAKDGVEPNESWDVLQEGRDVLALMRERDALRLAATAALAHAEALVMDTPEEKAVVTKLAETLRMALTWER